MSGLAVLMERDCVVGLSDRHEIGPSYNWVGLRIIIIIYSEGEGTNEKKEELMKRKEWNRIECRCS